MADSVGKMQVQQDSVDANVSAGVSNVVRNADLDVASWDMLFRLPVALASGVVPFDAPSDTLLFNIPIAPRKLVSDKSFSRIAYIASLFRYWNGEIEFELLITKAIFQQVKICMAFVPTESDQVPDVSAFNLIGFHNNVILNAVNDASAKLSVPFVSSVNWLDTNSHTGWLIVKTLSPIVATQVGNVDIPWLLTVSADPAKLRFRYVLPPPLPGTGNNPVEPDEFKPTGDLFALTISNQQANDFPTRDMAVVPYAPPLQSSSSHQLLSAIMVPRTRIEFVNMKIRGEFDVPSFTVTGNSGLPYTSVFQEMFDLGGQSLEGREWGEPVSLFSIYPQLQRAPAVQNSLRSTISYKVNEHGIARFSFLRESPALSKPPITFDGIDLKIDCAFESHFNQRVFQASNTFAYQSTAASNFPGFVWDTWVSAVVENEIAAIAVFSTTFSWSSVSLASLSSNRVTWLTSTLNQIDSCPGNITHLALYTDAPPELAQELSDWMVSSTRDPPPEWCSCFRLYLTNCQSGPLWNNERLLDSDVTRGIIWRLFKLFKGDESSPWAWLVKGADIILDFIIGAFLGKSISPVISLSSTPIVAKYDSSGNSVDLPRATTVRLPTIKPTNSRQVETQLDALTMLEAESGILGNSQPPSPRSSRASSKSHASKSPAYRKRLVFRKSRKF